MSEAKTGKKRDIRLYVDIDIRDGQASPLTADQVHYLTRVMRCTHGDQIKAFNGRGGEWRMQLEVLSKKQAVLLPREQTRLQHHSPDLWLLFAPVKKTGTEFIIEKATELGVSRLQPVLTARSQNERLRMDRLTAIMTEAAEQCERLDLPELMEPRKLVDVLADWPAERSLWACLERHEGSYSPMHANAGQDQGSAAILIGPEGGFDETEQNLLADHAFVQGINLGPRILRAETAAIAAVTLWQARSGDW